MSVAEIQNCLIKYKKPLAVFVSLCLLLCIVYLNVSQSYTAEIYIKYIDEKAEQGLTPDGHELNPYEMTDALVVKKALNSIGIKSTNYNSIRKSITVTPVVLSSEEAKYASYIDSFSDYDNTEENKPHPIFYSVRFTTKQGEEFARKFLDALIVQYRIYYVEKYAYNDDMTLISEKAVMEFDYYETATVLENKLRNNIDYLNNIVSSDSDFRSPQTGFSMKDLAVQYESILHNDLADVSQLIIENGISKNSVVLRKALQTRADNAALDSNANSEKAATQMELLEAYSNKNKEYVWNSSEIEDEYQIFSDTERDLVYSTDKSVYDEMISDFVSYSIKSRDLIIDKDIYLSNVERFSNKSEQNSQVEELLSKVCKKYNTVQQLTEKTISDYNYFKSSRYLASVSGIAASKSLSGIIYYVSTLVISLGFGILFIVFLELKRKKKI